MFKQSWRVWTITTEKRSRHLTPARSRCNIWKTQRSHHRLAKLWAKLWADPAEYFPECVARAPVSLRGSGGGGCVRWTLRLRPQPFATVRNRPQPFAWGPYGCAYGKFCNRGHFWRCPASRCFVSRGRRGTSWDSDVFHNLSIMVLHGRRDTTFSED